MTNNDVRAFVWDNSSVLAPKSIDNHKAFRINQEFKKSADF